MAKNFIGMGNLAQICSNEMNAEWCLSARIFNASNFDAQEEFDSLVCLKKEPPEFTAV